MAKKKQRQIGKSKALVFLAVGVALCASVVLGWMIAKEVYLADTKDVRESKTTIVINTERAPSDLVDTLLAESGCKDITVSGKNIDYIVREKNDIALVHYGCALDAYMYYKKANGKWTGISPTNQFIDGTPLCSHLKENNIPASFQAHCYDHMPTGPTDHPTLMSNPVS